MAMTTKKRELKPVRIRHDDRTPGVTYQLEHVLCGKAKCRKLHGPYWYAYWKRNNRLRKKYIGKRFAVVDRRLIDAQWLERPGVLGNPSSSSIDKLPKTGKRRARTSF